MKLTTRAFRLITWVLLRMRRKFNLRGFSSTTFSRFAMRFSSLSRLFLTLFPPTHNPPSQWDSSFGLNFYVKCDLVKIWFVSLCTVDNRISLSGSRSRRQVHEPSRKKHFVNSTSDARFSQCGKIKEIHVNKFLGSWIAAYCTFHEFVFRVQTRIKIQDQLGSIPNVYGEQKKLSVNRMQSCFLETNEHSFNISDSSFEY